ncbi:hypothetical protein BJ878DRAFT_546658 [Calycina marina]|uniref:PCI domain-containing protein n=1 Tax=Calycina marina TaxID=1763456 RepID=A0A9P7YVA8_9HELO|nr:hypothetical protein BJ878DRAFT_546658 [Calycina marina]
MEQIKALNALEPFLALTKSATSPRAAADLITRATSHPNTFVFAELLSTLNIQALAQSDDYSLHLTLLQIFSYGTYTDYQSTPSLPPLNAAQTVKLRQLSFLSLARTPENLTYPALLKALGLQGEAELEQLVISIIYAGLVTGTLDPYHQRVLISSVAPLRDLPPASIPSMIATLVEWSSRCTSTLSDLEDEIARIRALSAARRKSDEEWNAAVEKLIEGKEKERSCGGGSSSFTGGGKILGEKRDNERISDEDEAGGNMSPEEEGERASKYPRKKGTLGGFFGK